MPISSTTMTDGSIHFLPREKHSAAIPAVAAVTCPEGKEKPSSAGEPTASQKFLYCAIYSKGLGLATRSFRMMLVISAPQHTAPKMHTPILRVREKHISPSANRNMIIPFSPRKLMTFIRGVRKPPAASASLFIRERMALSYPAKKVFSH